MANIIIDKLNQNNKEFNIIFNSYVSKGLIHNFTDIYDIFEKYLFVSSNMPNLRWASKINLKEIYQHDLNLLSPYLTCVNTINALLGHKVLDEVITTKPKIVYGKQYLTKNFPNVYDCTSLWIETNKYIVDPVLCIVVDKSIKDKMFYKEMYSRTNYILDFNRNSRDFSLVDIDNYIYNLDKVMFRYIVPKTISELVLKPTFDRNLCNNMRNFLKERNRNMYNDLMTLIKLNRIEDLSDEEHFKLYDKINIAGKYNPDLTLGDAFRKGLNYGKCGLFAKLLSNTMFKDVPHIYNEGFCHGIIGSKNCVDGNHAWLEYNGKIYDFSLLMAIPVELKTYFGYEMIRREQVGGGQHFDTVFGEKVNIFGMAHYHDIMFENIKNGTKLYRYDFTEELPSIIDEDGLDKYVIKTISTKDNFNNTKLHQNQENNIENDNNLTLNKEDTSSSNSMERGSEVDSMKKSNTIYLNIANYLNSKSNSTSQEEVKDDSNQVLNIDNLNDDDDVEDAVFE